MTRPSSTTSKLRILDFDTECAPGFWIGGDYVTKHGPLALAARWIDSRRVYSWLVTDIRDKGRRQQVALLEGFRDLFDEADVVTGHFIRGFDLPLVNAAMIRHGLALLEQKMTVDTKLDLVRTTGLSQSQENLGALLRLVEEKVPSNEPTWSRAVHDKDWDALSWLETRVVGDVNQHVALYRRLRDLGYLRPAKLWQPTTGGGRYHA